ncbi:hypothetical protein ACFVT2_27400 [Streptomyces sp. NPDC058000]|uniref:hypothetical protein n=1 Tax=Streptomyces sp. NPDC058000 TaxID=3346299 RepID=UPI0036E24240
MPEMDALLNQVMPAISAAVGAYGVGVLTRAEDEAADATVRLGHRLLARILHRSAEPAPVRVAVGDLAEAAQDPDALAAMRLQLKKALAGDPGLAAELEGILPEKSGSQQTGERGVAIGGDNPGIVATGDGATNVQLR